MSGTDKRDRIQELTDVPFPASSAPEPLILADEGNLAVAYIPVRPPMVPADGSDPPSTDEATAIVVFRQCFAIHFGLPNDEAFDSHPLADRGLRPCGAFEVERSSWVRGLEMRNRAHPRHDAELFQQLRHWVWTFQDSVLECAAVSYAVVQGHGRPAERQSQMHALLRGS